MVVLGSKIRDRMHNASVTPMETLVGGGVQPLKGLGSVKNKRSNAADSMGWMSRRK